MIKLMYANSSDRSMFYATRANIHDPFFMLEVEGKRWVFLNGLEYGAYVEKNSNPNIVPVRLEDLLEDVAKLKEEASGASKLGLVILQKYNAALDRVHVPANFPIDIADFLRSRSVTVQVLSPLFPERAIKTIDEVAAIREVCRRTNVAFQIIEQILSVSTIAGQNLLFEGQILTSEFLKIEAERELLKQDLLNVEDMIISCGPQAAMPHHRGSGPIAAYQTIVCDIYPQHRTTGYFADISRTYVKGETSVEIRKMYEAVRDSQKLSIHAVRPGISFMAVQKISEELFLERGYTVSHDKGFIHSIGHGLGVEVHELPFIRSNAEVLLEPGNVITIEPGLYYPNLGGVRIEDVVLVTETGHEVLSTPRDVWIL